MYERFTDRARRVYQLANQEAQRFNHDFIGTEHILLGLLKEGSGVASNVLKNLGMELGTIRREVEKIVQAGQDIVTMGKLPQTPCAKKVAEYAIEEAKNLNHNYVGTEHVLLGLLHEQEKSVALRVFKNLGIKLEDVREETMNLLGRANENDERKENEQIVKTITGILAIPKHEAVRGFAQEFLERTGIAADRVELCSRIEGGITHYWFQERVINQASVTTPEKPSCNCKSLLHGHEVGCPLR